MSALEQQVQSSPEYPVIFTNKHIGTITTQTEPIKNPLLTIKLFPLITISKESSSLTNHARISRRKGIHDFIWERVREREKRRRRRRSGW